MYAAALVSSAATWYAGAAGEGQAPLYNVAAAAALPPQNLAVHNISERCNEQRGVPGVLAVWLESFIRAYPDMVDYPFWDELGVQVILKI